jgi:hypothetical protein
MSPEGNYYQGREAGERFQEDVREYVMREMRK